METENESNYEVEIEIIDFDFIADDECHVCE